MDSDNKKVLHETGRWLRIGTLTLTTLTPLINLLAARLRDRLTEGEVAHILKEATQNSTKDQQERLQTLGAALLDVITQLPESPASQDLLKRGEDLTDELRLRWHKLSQMVADRGSQLSHDFVERGEGFSQQLARHSRTAQLELAEQDRRLWIGLGFGFGLTAAGITTFLLLRRRFKPTILPEEEPIQLPYSDTIKPLGKRPVDIRPNVSANGYAHTQETYQQPSSGNPTVALAEEKNMHSINNQPTPANATLVGVISTKLYYPIETLLDQLTNPDKPDVDVVYFSSVEEARAQGFTASA